MGQRRDCEPAIELSWRHWTRAHLMREKRIMRMAYRMRGLHTTLLLGTAFLAGGTIGPAFGLIARHFGVNAAFAQNSDRADTYRLLALFGDVFERVRLDYVDPVSDRDLIGRGSH